MLHSHFHGFDVASVLAARRGPGDAVVWHIHSTYSRNPLQVARAALKLGILGRRVDACCAPRRTSSTARSAPGARGRRSTSSPARSRPSSFPEGSVEERARARVALGLPPDATVLLHFGWHWRLKGGDIFLEAVKRARRGGVADVIAVERGGHEEYEELAHRLGIARSPARLRAGRPDPLAAPRRRRARLLERGSRGWRTRCSSRSASGPRSSPPTSRAMRSSERTSMPAGSPGTGPARSPRASPRRWRARPSRCRRRRTRRTSGSRPTSRST